MKYMPRTKQDLSDVPKEEDRTAENLGFPKLCSHLPPPPILAAAPLFLDASLRIFGCVGARTTCTTYVKQYSANSGYKSKGYKNSSSTSS